jgi:SAM-dependent methyltransferase
MRESGDRPYRVLELACGSGLLRVAVARRVPRREIHYTGIDVSLFGLQSLESLTRPGPETAHPEHSGGNPLEVGRRGDDHALQGRLRERFMLTELDLHDPKTLAAQLECVLGKERFDEIHMHLLHPRTHGLQSTGPQVLRVIARYLRAGGRLYHLFQNSSPLYDFDPERIRYAPGKPPPPAGTRGDTLGRNEHRFREGASKGGLLLDKCGFRWERGKTKGEGGVIVEASRKWITRRFAGAEPDRRTADIYERLAEQYSSYSRYANHFVILRKRRRGAATPQNGKPRGKAASALLPNLPDHLMVAAGELLWGPAPQNLPANAQIAVVAGDLESTGPYTVRLKMPSGYKIMPHWRPTRENITVLSGVLHVGAGSTFDESKGRALPVGGFSYVGPQRHHFAWAEGETEIQIHGLGPFEMTYVNPNDDPSMKTPS